MAIDKGLYQAPIGLEEAATAEPELEIEIENPESVSIGIDGMPILEMVQEEEDPEFSQNLAEELDESVLQQVASDLTSDFESDVSARRDWVETYVEGLKLLGDRKSTRLNSSHIPLSRMPSSA